MTLKTLIEFTVSFVICLFEISMFIILCDSFLIRRSNKKIFPILLAFGEYISFMIISYFISNNILRIVITLLLFTIVSCFGYKGQILYKLFLSMLFWIFLNSTEFICLFLITHIYRFKSLEIPFITPVIIISKLLIFIMLILVKKFFLLKTTHLYKYDWFILFLFPIYSVTIILILYDNYIKTNFINDISIFIAFFSLIFNIVLLLFLENFFDKRKFEIENQTLTLRIRNEEDKIKTLQESQFQLKKQAHDFENHLDTILKLLQNSNFEPIEDYIRKLSRDVAIHQEKIITGNVYIDTILTHKYYESINKNINITFDINDFTNFSIMEPHDIVSLISNTFDNAIESCIHCTDFKEIEIQLKYNNEEMLYSISNTVPSPVYIDINATTISTKSDISNHGYGMNIIKDIIKQYNGHINYSYYNGKVIFICIINNLR